MFGKVLAIENTKILKQSIFRIELLISFLLIAGLMLALYAISAGDVVDGSQVQGDSMIESVTWPGAFIQVLQLSSSSGLGAILVIVLTGAVTAQEFQWRTLHLWLSRGVPRTAYALGKFASLLLPVLLLVTAGLAAGSLTTAAASLSINGSLRLEQVDAAQLVMGVFRTAYTLLPYAALTFLLAVLTRSSAAAIGIGMAVSLVGENLAAQLLSIMGGVFAEAVKFFPSSMANEILQLNARIAPALDTAGASAPLSPGAITSAAGILLYTAMFLALATWSLTRQDLTG